MIILHFDLLTSLSFTCLMCLPFRKRVELNDRERFPESKPAKEKPFRMYNDNAVITVKLNNLEDGWELDKTNDTQVNCNFIDQPHTRAKRVRPPLSLLGGSTGMVII